jgi:tetratricopeptide (TPR) repeat protein
MWLRALIITSVSLSVWGIPRPDMKEQVRKFARLPKVELSAPLVYSLEAGFVALADTGSVQEQLSKLRKENKKDGSEGALFLKMARLHEQVNNRGEAVALYFKSAELLRKKAEIESSDVATLCNLSEALTALGRFREAEHYIEKAASLDSTRASVAAARAHLQKLRAYRTLVSDEIFFAYPNFTDSLVTLVREGCKSQQIEQAEKYLSEAGQEFDKAVELEPHNPEWLVRRAAFKSFRASLTRAMVLLRGGESTGQSFLQAIFTDEALGDLEQAASFDPAPALLGTCSMFELCSCTTDISAGRPRLFKDRLWEALSDQKRGKLLQHLERLQKLAESSDEKLAASAHETIGCIQYLALQDQIASESSFRQAIDRNPKQERSWDLLMLLLGNNGRVSELFDLCQDRAEANPSPRNLFLFAKAAERAGDLSKAESALLLAVGANPSDFLANLGLANVLMKRPDADDYLGRIQDSVSRAEKNLGPNPSYQNMLDLALTKSLYYTLSDDVERARLLLKEWLPRARDNSEINEMLMVLGY